MTPWMRVAVLVLLFFTSHTTILTAQSSSPAAADTAAGSQRTYLPADFARFAPRTAYDMLSRVPGFNIRQEDQERGLGQATGNVLINGQRTSGKSNDAITALTRIPAQNVQRIEIVDGATLGIPGLSGQVANVIVRSSAINGQFAYTPEFRAYYTDPLFTRFDLSVSGTRGPIEYTLGIDNRGNRSGAGGPTWLYTPDGALMESRDEVWRGNFDQPRLSGKFVYDGPGTAVGNLNASYRRIFFDYLETGTRTTTDGAARQRRVTFDEGGDSYEIGGDYDFDLGTGRLKLIALNRSSHTPYEENVITTYSDGSPVSGSRYAGTADNTELIGRSEYRWKRGDTEWQISAEGAFNSLDNSAQLFILQPDGIYEQIPLPGATARVAEDRYEVMGGYSRPLTSTVALKLSAGGEYSQLSQRGNAGGTRTFYRPKGEVSVAWQQSPVTALNFKLARRVGQLNFYDFLASVNLRDDVETAANPDLVPQQSWELDVEAANDLGKSGSTTIRLYARLIDDIIDYIPIGATGQSPGNLDQATVYGIESRSTMNLDRFGWRGVRVDAHFRLQDSEVEDPLTRELRPISNSLLEQSSLSLRHDVPATDWAWGGSLQYYYSARSYRLTEVGRMWEGPVWADLYVEHKDFYGLTLRAGAHNLLGADSMWDRTVYAGRRTGPVQFIEVRDRQIGPIFSFAIRGKF